MLLPFKALPVTVNVILASGLVIALAFAVSAALPAAVIAHGVILVPVAVTL